MGARNRVEFGCHTSIVVIPVGSLESNLGLLKSLKIRTLQEILLDRNMRVVDKEYTLYT
jgi:hypothetical protein